jgi:hypothetical protein
MPADSSDDQGLHDWSTFTRVAAPPQMLDPMGPKNGACIIPLAGGRLTQNEDWGDYDAHCKAVNAHEF